MGNFGLAFPTLEISQNNIISIIIQTVIFLVIAGIVIYMISIYFKNMELKADPQKNEAQIEENLEKIRKIKKWFIKIGGIAFAVVVIGFIIINNFIKIF